MLISSIMKLDGEQMTGVVDFSQSAMHSAACGDGDEVGIPVDELDTYTLRTLQEYVQVSESPLQTMWCAEINCTVFTVPAQFQGEEKSPSSLPRQQDLRAQETAHQQFGIGSS